MTTFAELKTRIANDIARPDLMVEIGRAINVAIREYARHRWHWHKTRAVTFNTVAGEDFYNDTANDAISRIVKFDLLMISDGIERHAIERCNSDVIELMTDTQTARQRPSLYAYIEEHIRFWPVPDKIYPVRITGLVKPVELSADTDTNKFLDYAEPLIRMSAIRRVRSEIMGDTDGALVAKEVENAAFFTLRTEDALREGIGRIIPTEF
jgi:hypothetical protein